MKLYDEFLLARWFYLVGEHRYSDTEYDDLEKRFRQEYPDDPHSRQIWSLDECPVEQLKAIGREDLIINTVMGYMAESIPSINSIVDYEDKFKHLSEKSRVSFKIDGWNTRVSYYNGQLVKVESRGRSGNNIDMSALYSLFPREIKYKGRVAVTGELSIPNDKWPEYKLLTGNVDQRASVRTAIAQKDIGYLSFLAFNYFSEEGSLPTDQYVGLTEMGFFTPFYKWVNTKADLDATLKYMSELSEMYNYLTDGLVIENSEYQLAIRLGAWAEKRMVSKVIGYEQEVGMYSNYLKLKIEPITIEGKTFSRIPITNISNIIELGLYVGEQVAFSQRSSANIVVDNIATRQLHQQTKEV